ncbi:MAG: DUF58 domain-containing protein [Lachnospiraceae bacterium]|nr:DUF58 domain-containing protein [Lachnospiraceae bacterium]
MKRNRIILLILWVLSLIGISFYGGQISYGLFILFSLIPIISLLYILCVYLLFKIYQNIDARDIVCNNTATFYFTLQNESLISFSGVRVLFYSTFSTISGLDDKTEYELRPKIGIKKQTDIVCKYRGEYEVGIKKVVIQDFFRLFSITYKNREPFRVTVRPNIVQLTELMHADITMSAVRDSRVNQYEPDVISREYVSGDDIRMMNWKISAGIGKFMVREKTGEQQQGVGIIMDSCRISNRIEEYLPLENKILEAAIALNLFFSQRGIPVSTYYESTSFEERFVDKDKGFEEFYEKMSSFVFDETHTNELLCRDILDSKTIFMKKAVFMIVHKWDEALANTANEITRNNIPIVVYIISDDINSDHSSQLMTRTSMVRISTDSDLTEVM